MTFESASVRRVLLILSTMRPAVASDAARLDPAENTATRQSVECWFHVAPFVDVSLFVEVFVEGCWRATSAAHAPTRGAAEGRPWSHVRRRRRQLVTAFDGARVEPDRLPSQVRRTPDRNLPVDRPNSGRGRDRQPPSGARSPIPCRSSRSRRTCIAGRRSRWAASQWSCP